MRFQTIGSELDQASLDKHNSNLQQTDNDLTSLQQQITAEQQQRIAADSAHAVAAAAHTAEQIAYAPGTSVKAKMDAQQAQINGIVGSTGNSNTEIVDARLGADGSSRATLGTLVREIHAQLLAAAVQSASIRRGLNYLQVDQATPLNLSVFGRTLINLLGKDGNFEIDANGDGLAEPWIANNSYGVNTVESTSSLYGSKAQRITGAPADASTARGVRRSNVLFEAGKYYLAMADVVANSNVAAQLRCDYDATFATKVFTASVAPQTAYVKFNPNTSITNGIVRLYNMDPLGSTNWVQYDGARIYEIDAATYAKIDVDPEYTGDKLAAKFPYVDGVKHIQNVSFIKSGKNLLPPLTEWSVHANAAVTEPYKLTLNATASSQSTTIVIPVLPSQTYTFRVTGEGTGARSNIDQLAKDGSTVTSLPNSQSAEGNQTTTFTTDPNTTALIVSLYNSSTGVFTFSNPQLEFGSVATSFEPRNDDYVFLPTNLAASMDGLVRDAVYYRDGSYRKLKRWISDFVLDGSMTLGATSDFTGFKLFTIAFTQFPAPPISNSTKLLVSKYNGVPLVLSSDNSTADRAYMGSSSFAMTASDADTGFGETYTPTSAEFSAYLNGWKMNNGTFGTPYNGTGTKTWTRWDATNNTGAVTATPTTLAAGFTPYTLSYQLATPIEEVIVGAEGGISLNAGGNMLELGEGVIVREKAVPLASTANYWINSTSTAGTNLKNRAAIILAIYKNGVKDNKWTVGSSSSFAYGNQRASIPIADYDPTAEYTVTYIALDKYAYTANAVDASGEYNSNPKTALDQVIKRLADIETTSSINVRLIADLYRRMKVLGG
ncbi:hypothetical protein [Paenibacillus silvisoli]|uniref:hypothetical protein n=1 Tax=Paenibacillus silvisoli TaxID=3110539 RepID=UPI00280435C7|nr:hypothetical protein [Paenibacillus silvisoli]